MKYLPFLLAVSCFGLAGCQQSVAPIAAASLSPVSVTYAKPLPSPPPPGMVRIVPTKIQSDTKTVRWQYVIVGDRNWSGIGTSMYDAELSGSYPLNATPQRGGRNTAECEITFKASTFKGLGATGHPILEVRNRFELVDTSVAAEEVKASSEGEPMDSDGPVFVDGTKAVANKSVKPLLTEEKLLPLPVNISVLEVTTKKLDGTLYKKSFRLKISK